MTTIETLRAVHHPTRRRIIDFLFLHGPSQVGTLARELDQQVGSISHHLRMLERVGLVEQAPELAIDGRTSWWRTPPDLNISWSPDDFADNPADHTQARVAQRLNTEHQLAKLSAFMRASDGVPRAWRRAAFSNDFAAMATPAELDELCDLLVRTCREWRDAIDTDDGQERAPVFVFAHGFPSRP